MNETAMRASTRTRTAPEPEARRAFDAGVSVLAALISLGLWLARRASPSSAPGGAA